MAQKWSTSAISEAELLAQIDASHIFMCYHLLRTALHQHLAIVENISPVYDLQCLAHVMIRDLHAQSTMPQIRH